MSDSTVIKNLSPDPSCLRKAWWMYTTTQCVQDTDNRWTYSLKTGAAGTMIAFAPMPRMGTERYGMTLVAMVQASAVQSTTPTLALSSCSNIQIVKYGARSYWVSGVMNNSGALAHEVQWRSNDSSPCAVKLLAAAVYTAQDWKKVMSAVSGKDPCLTIPWWGTPTAATADCKKPSATLIP